MPEAAPGMKLDSLDTLFAEAWRLYKERFQVLIGIALVPAVVFMLERLAIDRRTFGAAVAGGLIGLVGWFVTIVAGLALIAAIARAAGVKDSYGAALKLFWAALWLYILEGVIIVGGMVLLIVPGIFLAIALSLANFTFFLEGKRGMQALAESREYVRGYWWAILGRSLLLTLVYGVLVGFICMFFTVIFGTIVGSIVYGVLLLAMIPFGICYTYTIYENLRRLKPAAADDAARASRTFFKVCIVVGLVAALALLLAVGFFVGFAGGALLHPKAI